MGCDIHLFVEKRVNNGEWQTHPGHVLEDEGGYVNLKQVSSITRDYSLFAALAGVRGDGPDPRGIPEDLSTLIQEEADRWDGDGHSHSWLTLEEFKKVLEEQDYEPSTDTRMFYDWRKLSYDERPPYYTTIVTALEKERSDELAELTLLKNEEDSVIDYRIVFWFDN